MRFDFSRFLLKIEQRFRRIHGFSLACRTLFYASIACVAVNLVLGGLAPERTADLGIFVLLLPVMLAAAAFVRGWWKRPDLPHLLLQLDDELDSGARISSLYEVDIRGGGSIFRTQLESRVESMSADWKRGIRLPRRTIGLLSAGIAGILVAGVVLMLPGSLPMAVSQLPTQKSEGWPVQAQVMPEPGQDSVYPASNDVAAPLESFEETAFLQLPSHQSAQPDSDLSLDSILDDLSTLAASQTHVGTGPSAQELKDLAETQGEIGSTPAPARAQQGHMATDSRRLAQQGTQALGDPAAQVGHPEMEQSSGHPESELALDSITDKLQDIIDQLDTSSGESAAVTDSADFGGDSETRPTTAIFADQQAGQQFLEQTARQLADQATAEQESTDQNGDSQQQPSYQRARDPHQPGEGASDNIQLTADLDDQLLAGGEDGIGGTSDDIHQLGEVGFIDEQAPFTVGTQGEFINEFVTQGVPVEIVPSQNQAGTHIIDFERMESILHERGLPDEGVDAIRRYFELITQPEGES